MDIITSPNDQKILSGPVAVVVLGQAIRTSRSKVIDTINVYRKGFVYKYKRIKALIFVLLRTDELYDCAGQILMFKGAIFVDFFS